MSSSLQGSLIGHEKNFNLLLNFYQQQTLSPCWLLNGQQGVGKATFAKFFAQSILANNPLNPNGLSKEVVQRQIQIGSYPNLLVVQKPVVEGEESHEIPVSEAKRVLDFLAHSAIIPGWRVVIVDAANELNRFAANCLLKIVEEPPPKTLILLLCHAWGQVLPTLRSRCQGLDFSPLTGEDVKDLDVDGGLFAVCQGSLGSYQQLVKAGGEEFLKTMEAMIQTARQGQWIHLQKFCQDTAKLPERFECLLWLLPSLVYQKSIETPPPIIPAQAGIQENCGSRIARFSKDRPNGLVQENLASGMTLEKFETKQQEWLAVAQKLNHFLAQAKTSHLDKTQFLLQCFLLIENPSL